MVKNKYSQIEKKVICDKHRSLVRLLYRIGFEKMLQQQAIEIALMFSYYQSERDVKNAIQELEKYQIIKKVPTINNNKFLILCKYARAYVRDISDSQKVAAFDSDMSVANQFDRIARVQLFIDHAKSRNYLKFKQIKTYNTLTTREDLTHEFLQRLLDLNHKQFNQVAIAELRDKSLSEAAIKRSARSHDHQASAKKKFDLDNDTVTLRQLIQKNIYLENITENQSYLIFEFDLMDANNRYTPRKFKENVIYIEKFLDNIVKVGHGFKRVQIKINYISTDQGKTDYIIKEMNSKKWDKKNACYVGDTKLESLSPLKIIESTYYSLSVSFRALKSPYFRSN